VINLRLLKGAWKVFTLVAKDTRFSQIHLALEQSWCKNHSHFLLLTLQPYIFMLFSELTLKQSSGTKTWGKGKKLITVLKEKVV